MKKQAVLKNDHVTAPESVFKTCPVKKCESNDLFSFDGDVFCNECGWNSIEQRVSAAFDDHVERWRQRREQLALPLTYGCSLALA